MRHLAYTLLILIASLALLLLVVGGKSPKILWLETDRIEPLPTEEGTWDFLVARKIKVTSCTAAVLEDGSICIRTLDPSLISLPCESDWLFFGESSRGFMARVADDRFRIPLLPLGLGAVAIPLLVEAARWRARALRRASGCCVACGYSMTGAVSSRCPECGSDWAPRRGETTRSRRVEAWRRASRVAAAVMRSLLEILVGPAVVWFALHAWHTQLATRSTNGAFVLVLIAPVVGILVLGILIWATWAVTNRFDQLSSEKRRRQARQLAMIGAAVSQVSLIVLAFSK